MKRSGSAFVLFVLFVVSSATAAHGACAGDCDENGTVTVGELVQAVNLALGIPDIAGCPATDTDGNGEIGIAELLAAVNSALIDCLPGTPLPTPTISPASATVTPTPNGADQIPPTDTADLLAWLQAGRYLGWPAEGGRHPSSGPHFGSVRTYINDRLNGSLADGAAQHPMDAAAVKELYGSGDTLRGWAVTLRVAETAGGASWYWFEHYNGTTLAAGLNLAGCTGCHAGGTDFVCSPFPLQPGGQSLPAQCP
jgi:hypothetical protein